MPIFCDIRTDTLEIRRNAVALVQRYSFRNISGVYRLLDIYAVAAIRVAGLRGWQAMPRVLPERTATVGSLHVQLHQEKPHQQRCRSRVLGAKL